MGMFDDLDRDTKESDSKMREGAERYDREVGQWWQLKDDKPKDRVDEDSEDDSDDENDEGEEGNEGESDDEEDED